MKLFAKLLLLALLATPAAAQDARPAVEQWVHDVLTNRAYKMWTPQLYAGPQTAVVLGTVDGLAISVDPALPEGQIVIRNKDGFTIPDMTDGPGFTAFQPAGSEMARLQWR